MATIREELTASATTMAEINDEIATALANPEYVLTEVNLLNFAYAQAAELSRIRGLINTGTEDDQAALQSRIAQRNALLLESLF